MEYSLPGLLVEYHPNIVRSSSKKLLAEILPLIKKQFRYTKAGKLYQKRYKLIYGKDHAVVFRGKEVVRKAQPFTENILKIKKRIENYTGEIYNSAFVQYYPSGKVGINPHRDKEVKRGCICSISIGDTRNFTFRRENEKLELKLDHASLLIIRPPTNFYWTHELEPKVEFSGEEKWRLSIIFRILE